MTVKLLDKRKFTPLCLTFLLLLFSCCQSNTQKKDTTKIVEKKPPTPSSNDIIDTSKYLKEQVLAKYIDVAEILIPDSKNRMPFDKLDYDKIIAYDFEGCEEPYSNVINRNGKFVPVVLRQQFLTQEKADKILSILTRKSTYGEVTAACFRPHFTLVFYKNNKMVNQISICLDCNYLLSDIAIPAQTHYKINLGTKNEYAIIGFTSKGKRSIIGFCKELKFKYGRTEDSNSD